MFNIGGSYNTESSRSRSTSSGFFNRTDSYQAGSFDTFRPLRRVTNELGEFDLNQVIADSNSRAAIDTQGAVSNIFRRYQETALPEIFGAQGSTGAYGSTTGQLLANDAFSRTTNQAAELQLGVASSYIGQNLQARDQLINQFAQLLQANLQQSGSNTSRGSESQTTNTRGRTTGVGFTMGYGVGGGAGTRTGGGG